jgi:outer membrane lipoprotein carrier protein
MRIQTSYQAIIFCRLPAALCLLPFIFPSPSLAGASGNVSAADIITRLQARYESTAGFRANFTQEVESATLGQKVESHGTVSFKKPGRMRWDFAEPKQTLVSDGAFFWLYQPAERQVIKTPFQEAFRSNLPVTFLTGVGRIDKDFAVAVTRQTEETYYLRLTPQQDADAVGTLELVVQADNFDIIQAIVTDPLGNVTRLSFSNINHNPAPDESLFHFTVPNGVDVIEPFPESNSLRAPHT